MADNRKSTESQVFMTRTAQLGSRVPPKWQARFCSGGGRSDSLAYHNRPLRRAVLWRRKSFGTQSESGSLFVERILTAVTTLRQQQRDVLGYLTKVCQAAIGYPCDCCLLPDL